MASMADKHLSKYGRFGDTEMYTTKHTRPGSKWHANKAEVKIMNLMGAEGEKLVDALGSGTINPVTGKEEKWVEAALMGASFAMNLVEGSAQKDISRQQGASQSALMSQKMKDIDKAEKAAEESLGAQKKILDFETQKGFEGVTQQFSQKASDVEQSSKQAIQQSGLKTSSAVTKQETTTDEKLQRAYESTNEKMMADYGKMAGSLEGEMEVKKAQFKSQREQTKAQKAMYDSQASQKGFFGNLMDMVS
jgi:hypothetical protein